MILKIFLFSLFLLQPLFAQQIDSLFSVLKDKFASFEYQDAIKISSEILINKENLNKETLLEVYRIKSVSYYSQGNENSAEDNFIALLDVDTSYVLDSIINSPKIVSFFNGIKSKYVAVAQSKENKIEELYQSDSFNETRLEMRNSILKSFILPGWGQISNGENTKGAILSTIFLASLGSMLYYANDCSKKEEDYLTETDRNLIPAKYDKYNKTYKLRNITIASTIVVWIYSQIDLLFFNSLSNDFSINSNQPGSGSQAIFNLKFRL